MTCHKHLWKRFSERSMKEKILEVILGISALQDGENVNQASIVCLDLVVLRMVIMI